MTTNRRKVVLPIVVVLGASVVGGLLSAMNKPVETKPPDTLAPLVRTVAVAPETVQLAVRTTGTVEPRTESDLVPEVSGRVVWVAPMLAAGGFFDEGTVLLRVDTADYDTALRRARAAADGLRSQARHAARNRDRSRSLAEEGLLSRVDLDAAENAARVAASQLAEADAAVERAERDLERTDVRSPFAGRVRSENVDVGQFVERGRAVAALYAVDYAEVRLPIPDDQLVHLDVPLDGREIADGPRVNLTASFGGTSHKWRGRIVRTEAEIDPVSRMVHAVARIDDPYGRSEAREGPPLAVGMFVEAEIVGRVVAEATIVPRAALRDDDTLWVLDHAQHLRARPVEIIRIERERVVVASGLAAGDRVCVSTLDGFVDGMLVRTLEPQT